MHMREKATENTPRFPVGYRKMLRSMEKHLVCRRCGRHVGLDWRTRGAYALHAECAELHDMREERIDLEKRVEGMTPAAYARLRQAEAQLAAASRRRV
jgi:hypothetical protein